LVKLSNTTLLIVKLKHRQAFISVAKKTKTPVEIVQNTPVGFIGSLKHGWQIPYKSFQNSLCSKKQQMPAYENET